MTQDAVASREEYRIPVYEAGPDGCVPVSSVARIFQDMAARNADKLDFSQQRMAELGLGWALTRMYVRMERYPQPEQVVVCETWPSGLGKYNATRDFMLEDMNGTVLARATSTWVTFDMNKRQMVPPPEFMHESYPEISGRSLEYSTRNVKRVRDLAHSVTLPALRCHLDMNGHVNNTNLMDWCLEPLPDEVYQGLELESMDISFRKECTAGVTVTSGCTSLDEEGLTHGHSLLHEDGQEAARAHTTWRNKA